MQSKMVNTSDEYKGFPKLMINLTEDVVVLFYSRHKGQVVHSETSLREVGEHLSSWDMGFFKDFSGTITITA